jgi:hypothetical protein
MTALRAASLAVRFVLELGALAALAWWGSGTGSSVMVNVVLGLGLPLLMAAVWGAFVAPKARRRLPDPERLLVEVVIFGAATLALAASGAVVLGAVFGVLAFATCLLVRALGVAN